MTATFDRPAAQTRVARPTTDYLPLDVYDRALARGHGQLIDDEGCPLGVGVAGWLAPASGSDQSLLSRCTSTTLDVACGPGRMAAALTDAGVSAMGIDVSARAISLARARGVWAIRSNLFAPVPGEGCWPTVLLADGNIGIGGDPVALLRRVAAMIRPDGRVVVEVDPPGGGIHTRMLRLEVDDMTSDWFPWARVSADSVGELAARSGLVQREVVFTDDRWVAVLDGSSR